MRWHGSRNNGTEPAFGRRKEGQGTAVIVKEDARTSDIAEAERLLGRVYHRGTVLQGGHPFRFRQQRRGDARVTLARYRIPSHTELAIELENTVAVGSVRAGTYRATSNGVEVDPTSPFLLRPGLVQSWSDGLDLAVANLRTDALDRDGMGPLALRRLLRDGPLGPIDEQHRQQWDAAAKFAAEALYSADLFDNVLIRRAVTDALLATARVCFALEADAPQIARAGAQPAALRRALRYIDDNAAEPIGLEDIARAARLSPRGLQDLFRRALHDTPTGRLRTVRLAAARSDLTAADASDTSVAQIAHKWGFASPARFAGYYRSAYGEAPSQTLRR